MCRVAAQDEMSGEREKCLRWKLPEFKLPRIRSKMSIGNENVHYSFPNNFIRSFGVYHWQNFANKTTEVN